MIRTIRPGFAALLLWIIATASTALGQVGGGTGTGAGGGNTSGSDQLSKILSDPEKLEELKKERLRPPIEFFRSQVMPNDILPYIKANHWTMVGLEMRTNHEDYEGSLQTRPVELADQPHEMLYRRDARLIKGQRARLTMPIFLPRIPKELGFQLVRPEAIRQDEEWPAPMKALEPHQQMVIVLSKLANDQFSRWSQFRATLPSAARREDPMLMDRQRYYRMVLPLDPDKPLLSAHPLTWSAISHVVWDGMAPEIIGTGQQQAIIDWLHFGGQLIVVGGAGPAFAPLRESFLAPYLPADPSGENVMRTAADLTALSEAYPPPGGVRDPEDPVASGADAREAWEVFGRRYKPPAPIPIVDKKPMFITGLTPRPGASVIPMGGEGNPPLGVEWKVGRGRVLMLAVSLSDPDLIAWPGFDTMVRRVVLRRPEERQLNELSQDGYGSIIPPRYEPLNGRELTGVRYLSRDLGAPARVALDEDGQPIGNAGYIGPNTVDLYPAETPVGEWLDSAALPSLSRTTLENASGIEIPGRMFVLKVILGYILVLVPLNYLICRYLLGRREWAWVVVPTLSLAFAIGVERAAAFDVGFDSSCDEVDLIETHGEYPRGHVSRFASLYSTGRVKFTISYPNDPTALALPLSTGHALMGEESTQSSFQTQPIPALTGFQVQPRSLAMFRAEQMASLPGTVYLSPPDQGRLIVNESGLDLKDAWVVEVRPEKEFAAVQIGPIAQGAKVPLGDIKVEARTAEPPPPAPPAPLEKSALPTSNTTSEPADATPKEDPAAASELPITVEKVKVPLDPAPFLKLLRDRSVATRPEEVGELRLIAWAEKPLAGQAIDPPVDRQRGFTLVVAHLRPSPLLDPGSIRYYAQANGPEKRPVILPLIQIDPNSQMQRFNMGRPRIMPPRGAPGAGGPGVPATGLAPTSPAPPPMPQAPTPTPTPTPAPSTPPQPL